MRTKAGLLKKAATTIKRAVNNNKYVRTADQTLRKQYQEHKGLLSTIDKKIPEYVDQCGLSGAGVVTEAAQQGIRAGVDLYHKMKKHTVKPRGIVKTGRQLSSSVCSSLCT